VNAPCFNAFRLSVGAPLPDLAKPIKISVPVDEQIVEAVSLRERRLAGECRGVSQFNDILISEHEAKLRACVVRKQAEAKKRVSHDHSALDVRVRRSLSQGGKRQLPFEAPASPRPSRRSALPWQIFSKSPWGSFRESRNCRPIWLDA
jgi:hypothetical protein